MMIAEEFYEFVHRSENRDRVFELENGIVIELSLPGKRVGFSCANVTGILGTIPTPEKEAMFA